MVTFKFLRESNNMLHYSYCPEGKGELGEVAVSVDGKSRKLIQKSNDDLLGNFASHAMKKIIETIKSNNVIPKNGIVAWY